MSIKINHRNTQLVLPAFLREIRDDGWYSERILDKNGKLRSGWSDKIGDMLGAFLIWDGGIPKQQVDEIVHTVLTDGSLYQELIIDACKQYKPKNPESCDDPIGVV